MRFCFFTLLFFLLLKPGKNHAQQDSTIYSLPDDDYEIYRDTTWGESFDVQKADLSKVNRDSLRLKLERIAVWNDSVRRVMRAYNISLRSDSLVELYNLLSKNPSKTYTSYNVIVSRNHSDLSELNQLLSKYSWPAVNEWSFDVDAFVAFCWKRNRVVHDYALMIGLGRKNEAGGRSVYYDYINPFNYTFGYSVLNLKRLAIYPFAGLSPQYSNFYFSNEYNESFTSLPLDSVLTQLSAPPNGGDFLVKKWELIFNYGLQIDFHLFYSERKSGVILGLRAGYGVPLIESMYKNDGQKYPELNGVRIRDTYFSAVVKFYWRRYEQERFDIKYEDWD